MAMNKKELQEMQNLRDELLRAKAMRFTEKVDYDVPPPANGSGYGALTVGYHINAYSRSVSMGCSSSFSHSRDKIDKTTAQGPLFLYSTKLLALRALRNALENNFSHDLAGVDAQIALELKTTRDRE